MVNYGQLGGFLVSLAASSPALAFNSQLLASHSPLLHCMEASLLQLGPAESTDQTKTIFGA